MFIDKILHHNVWRNRDNLVVLAMVLVLLVLHLAALFQVDDYIYDEDSYVAEANYILHGQDLDEYYVSHGLSIGFTRDDYLENGYPQHMPLGKLFLVAGIVMFGDNNMGWRVFPVLFGLASVILFYMICRRFSGPRWFPLIATFIFAFENLGFVMAGVAMLDIFALPFILAAFLLYLDRRYLPAAVMLALAVTCKSSAAFGGGIILLHWWITRRGWLASVKFVLVSLLAFFLLLPLLDFIATRELMYPWDRITFMFDVHDDSRLAQAPEAYRALFGAVLPWEWLTDPETVNIWPDPAYELNASWSLWVMIIPAMLFMLYDSVSRRVGSPGTFAVLWFALGYLPWFAVYWVFDRVSYMYYFYVPLGAVCLAMGYIISRVIHLTSDRRSLVVRGAILAPVAMWLTAHLVFFFLMAPIA